MKRAVNYSIHGLVRTGVPGLGLAFTAASLKIYFEQWPLWQLKQDNPDLTAADMYENMGLVSKLNTAWLCKVDNNDITTSLAEPDTVECIQKEFDAYSGFEASILLAPAFFFGVISAKALPKGIAYLQTAYRQITNSDKKVLTDKDFQKFRSVSEPKNSDL